MGGTGVIDVRVCALCAGTDGGCAVGGCVQARDFLVGMERGGRGGTREWSGRSRWVDRLMGRWVRAL